MLIAACRLDAHANVNFTIIVNPFNGPGSTQYPEDILVTAISKLNTYENVQLVGYVRTSWATRDLSTVLADVSTYSGWSALQSSDSNASTIALGGIFFDETPSEYSPEAATYLSAINEAVKNASGLLPETLVSQLHWISSTTSFNPSIKWTYLLIFMTQIIHNPGTTIDPRLDSPDTDMTVIFEGSYQYYQEREATLSSLPTDRTRYSYLIHSVPSMGLHDLGDFVDSISLHAGALFVTDLDRNYYESFGSNWKKFIRVMPP